MTKVLTAYLATLVAFSALDFVWLGFIAGGYYRSRLGALLLDKPNIAASAAFYAVYVVGIVIFAEAEAWQTGAWTTALIYGALFGFFAYGTYDLSNCATLKGFPVELS